MSDADDSSFGGGAGAGSPSPRSLLKPIWVRLGDGGWACASLKRSRAGTCECVSASGEELTVPQKDVLPRELLPADGVASLDQLSVQHPAAVFENWEVRFQAGLPHTACGGDVLALFNLNRGDDGHYTEEVAEAWRAGGGAELSGGAHLYMVAQRALEGLRSGDQFIAFSGGCGSGKSQAFRRTVDYLVGSALTEDHEFLSDACSAAMFLLGSAGNAKTSSNPHASKMAQLVQFRLPAVPAGGLQPSAATISFEVLMVDAARVHRIPQTECSFQIVHQLLASPATSYFGELLGDMRPTILDSFTRGPGISDLQDLQLLLGSMQSLGLSSDEQQFIQRAVATVLVLGQIRFEDGGDAVTADTAGVTRLAALLACDVEAVRSALESRRVVTHTSCTILDSDEIDIAIQLTRKQAARGRDGLCRLLYARLISWMAETASARALPAKACPEAFLGTPGEKPAPSCPTISLFDAPGTENFDPLGSPNGSPNGFYSLLVNYTDEKLQQQIMFSMIQRTQSDYANQSVQFKPAPFNDRTAVLELFECDGGIFSLLDDQIARGPSGSDLHFLYAISQMPKGNRKQESYAGRRSKSSAARTQQYGSLVTTPSVAGQTHFSVRHYADVVRYKVNGFCAMNELQTLADSTQSLVAVCTDPMMATLLEDTRGAKRTLLAAAPATTCACHLTQIARVVDSINRAGLHWVLCMRPNGTGTEGEFDVGVVTEQFDKYGLRAFLNFKRRAFEKTLSHARFLQRYSMCELDETLTRGLRHRKERKHTFESKTTLQSADTFAVRRLVHSTLQSVNHSHYAIGNTKVFLRKAAYETLESSRKCMRPFLLTTIQAWVRRHLARNRLQRLKAAKEQGTAATTVQSYWRQKLARRKLVREKLAREKLATRRRAMAESAGSSTSSRGPDNHAGEEMDFDGSDSSEFDGAGGKSIFDDLSDSSEDGSAHSIVSQEPSQHEGGLAVDDHDDDGTDHHRADSGAADDSDAGSPTSEKRTQRREQRQGRRQERKQNRESSGESLHSTNEGNLGGDELVKASPRSSALTALEPTFGAHPYQLPWSLVQLPPAAELLMEFYTEKAPAFATEARVHRIIQSFKRQKLRAAGTVIAGSIDTAELELHGDETNRDLVGDEMYDSIADSRGVDPRVWWLDKQVNLTERRRPQAADGAGSPSIPSLLPSLLPAASGDSTLSVHKLPVFRSNRNFLTVDQPHRLAAATPKLAAIKVPLALPSRTDQYSLLRRFDGSGSGLLSLLQVERAVSDLWPTFDNKPVLLKAFMATDESGSGAIGRRSFRKLLKYLVYFQDVWRDFEQMEQKSAGQVDYPEFMHHCSLFCHQLSAAEVATEFSRMDEEGGGFVRFDEFCIWCAHRHLQFNDSSPSSSPEPVSSEPKRENNHVPTFIAHVDGSTVLPAPTAVSQGEASQAIDGCVDSCVGGGGLRSDVEAVHVEFNQSLNQSAEQHWSSELTHPLLGMGFGLPKVNAALRACDGDVTRAADWLLSDVAAAIGRTGAESADSAAASGSHEISAILPALDDDGQLEQNHGGEELSPDQDASEAVGTAMATANPAGGAPTVSVGPSKARVDLSMSVLEWLTLHGASSVLPAFEEQGVGTAEDVTDLISALGDLRKMGLSEEMAQRLWPAVQALDAGGQLAPGVPDTNAETASKKEAGGLDAARVVTEEVFHKVAEAEAASDAAEAAEAAEAAPFATHLAQAEATAEAQVALDSLPDRTAHVSVVPAEDPAAYDDGDHGDYLLIGCPEGVAPGQSVSVVAPDGRELEVDVPEGVQPGQEFEVYIGDLEPAGGPTLGGPGAAEGAEADLDQGGEMNLDDLDDLFAAYQGM